MGGIVYTDDDDPWDVLKMIAQAGGGEVFPVSALLSCSFSAPRVSIGTIKSEDIIGDIDVPGTASRRLRRNTLIPSVRLESHGWEMVPLDAVTVPDYLAVDGGKRPLPINFPLVQHVDQGTQLGLYTLLNQRELDGIVLPCKVYMIGYRPGDCLTTQIPEAHLVGRDVILRQREIDSDTLGVTFTARSETPGKHPFCLGKTGKAPPTPDLSVPEAFPLNDTQEGTLISTSSQVGLIIKATDTTITISNHTRRYNDKDVAVAGAAHSGLTPQTAYHLYYDDADRAGGVVTYFATTAYFDAFLSVNHPARHYAGYVTTDVPGGAGTGGGGSLPPGGGGSNPYQPEVPDAS